MDSHTFSEIKRQTTFTPRFLLRTFSASSGGQQALNTPQAITPLAFLNSNPSKNIPDHTVQKLLTNLKSHVGFQEKFNTFFSSWSQDLTFIQNFINLHDESAYLAIIDTRDIGNVVVRAMELAEVLGDHSIHAKNEFLAFGPVSGNAYAAVPIHTLLDLGYKDFMQGNVDKNWREHLQPAEAIAAVFPSRFRLPIMAYFVAQVCGNEAQEIGEVVDALGEVSIPESWKRDPTLTGREVYLSDCRAGSRAHTILEKLVERAMAADEAKARETAAAEQSSGCCDVS